MLERVRHRPHAVILLGCVVCIAWLAGENAVAAEPVPVPGTRVSIPLPDGFTLASRFAGIADPSRGASVQVVELPAPVADMREDMNREALGARGLQVRTRDEVQAGIDNALLLDVVQPGEAGDDRLLILVAGSDQATVLLTARAPVPVEEALIEQLRKALLGSLWDPTRDVDAMASLAFTLDPAGGLQVAQTMMGSSVLLTLGGRQSRMEAGEPFMIVGQSVADDAVQDLGDYAEQRLLRTDGIDQVMVSTRESLTIDGRAAVELLATAVGENELKSTVYQLLIADVGGYVLAQGHVATAGSDEWLPVFERIGRGIGLR